MVEKCNLKKIAHSTYAQMDQISNQENYEMINYYYVCDRLSAHLLSAISTCVIIFWDFLKAVLWGGSITIVYWSLDPPMATRSLPYYINECF